MYELNPTEQCWYVRVLRCHGSFVRPYPFMQPCQQINIICNAPCQLLWRVYMCVDQAYRSLTRHKLANSLSTFSPILSHQILIDNSIRRRIQFGLDLCMSWLSSMMATVKKGVERRHSTWRNVKITLSHTLILTKICLFVGAKNF